MRVGMRLQWVWIPNMLFQYITIFALVPPDSLKMCKLGSWRCEWMFLRGGTALAIRAFCLLPVIA